jgi:hypothetical protein
MRSPCCLCGPLNSLVFYVVHVVLKESRRLVLPRTSSLFNHVISNSSYITSNDRIINVDDWN